MYYFSEFNIEFSTAFKMFIFAWHFILDINLHSFAMNKFKITA